MEKPVMYLPPTPCRISLLTSFFPHLSRESTAKKMKLMIDQLEFQLDKTEDIIAMNDRELEHYETLRNATGKWSDEICHASSFSMSMC